MEGEAHATERTTLLGAMPASVACWDGAEPLVTPWTVRVPVGESEAGVEDGTDDGDDVTYRGGAGSPRW